MAALWLPRTLRVRLTAWHVAVMVVVLAIYAAVVLLIVTRNASRALDARLRSDFRWAAGMAEQEPDGSLVVIDYKTHDSDERPDLHQKPGYRLQIAAYALMLEEATGRAVSRCVFVFLGPNSVHEVQVDDLPEAVAEVRRTLADDGDGERREPVRS